MSKVPQLSSHATHTHTSLRKKLRNKLRICPTICEGNENSRRRAAIILWDGMYSQNVTEETRRELTLIILENYSFLAPLKGQAYPAKYWLHPRVCVEQGLTRLLLVPSARHERLVGDEMLGAPSCSWVATCPAFSALRSFSRIKFTYPDGEFRRFYSASRGRN